MAELLISAAPTETATGASFWERHFVAIAAVLLAAMAIAMVAGVFLDSDVVDEPYHLNNGYQFLATGRLPVNTEHPPLSQVISAAPLLLLNIGSRGNQPGAANTQPWSNGSEFLYHNRVPAETILIASRLPKVLLTLGLGCLIAWWTRRHFGAAAGLAALALFAFDPTFIAHGHLATTDVAAALGFFGACLAWDSFLAGGKMRQAFVCGLVTGLALAVKYSALLLPALYLYWYLVQGLRQVAAEKPPLWRCSPRHLVKAMMVLAAGMFVAVYAAFGFDTAPMLPPELAATPFSKVMAENHYLASLGRALLQHPNWARVVDRWALTTPIPIPSLFRGFLVLSHHNVVGHTAYLLQQRPNMGGWWYYFPMAFAVKTPTGLLALLLLGWSAALLLTFRQGARQAIYSVLRARQEWFALTFPPLLYFLISITAHINIGLRHILPIYPFVFVWTAALLFSDRRPALPALFRSAAAIFLALVALESAAAFPRYIPFFNWASGGRSQGWKYLVDSNLDWGQDMKRLESYLKRKNALDKVCLASFSAAPLEHFGIAARPIPASVEEARKEGCLVVVSLSVLYEWPPLDGSYDWMKRLPVSERVGDSFNVYDLKKEWNRSAAIKQN